MSKFQKLAQINKIANECVQDGDFVLASKFHNEFMKIAQSMSEAKHTVGAGESLTTIARMYSKDGLSTSARKIMERNKLESSVIYPGAVLFIPLTGEKDPLKKPGISEEPAM
jgi:LysM repeat protein